MVAKQGSIAEGNNSNVLREYTDKMKRLVASGTYNRGRRPSGHVVREGFTQDRGGSIPPNLLTISNTTNDATYLSFCRERGIRPHPARFPEELRSFVEMLTDPGDVVVDPFAGSNITGKVAEALGRQWLAVEIDEDYLTGSEVRFADLQMEIVAERG